MTANIIGDMTEATVNMSDETRTMAFNTVFGTDAIRAANIVVQEGVEGYDDMFGAVTQTGMAQRSRRCTDKGFFRRD